MGKIITLLMVTVLVILLMPIKTFLLLGVFLGITWLPAQLFLFEDVRQKFLNVFEANAINLDDQIDRKSAFIIYTIANLVICFFIMLLAWPGMIVLSVMNPFLRSGGGTRETRY